MFFSLLAQAKTIRDYILNSLKSNWREVLPEAIPENYRYIKKDQAGSPGLYDFIVLFY
jgi:hypothetical protein